MTSQSNPDDDRYMAAALRLATRGLGRTWPNPAVGALVVDKDGSIVGAGTTAPGGRPHAEAIALSQAGSNAVGGTLYVTLEPCAHQGKTPPCCEAIVAAGIARIVCPIPDPDARVAGNGFQKMRDAGVEFAIGLHADRARRITAGHISRVIRNRPYIQLKLAISADGFIARDNTAQIAITGEASRALVHRMRAMSDAIMVGMGTVRADDPDLRCRLPGCGDLSPVRVVLDAGLNMPPGAKLVETAIETPVWVYTAAKPDHDRAATFKKKGVLVEPVDLENGGFLNLDVVLRCLAGKGITRLMVEGGAHLAKSLIDRDLIDELVVFTGPVEIGSGGLLPFVNQGIGAIAMSPGFYLAEARNIGEDRMKTYRKRSA
jgi:diaminohydroxyphosphoribosylaminopyrimidine deaminase / 5-amino-6-(5-phosphoribosylamino)uracil reductase